MKLTVRRPPEHKPEEIEGPEARTLLRSVIREVSERLLIPVAPHTGVLRRRMLERLRNGDFIWSEGDANGQPSGIILSMPPLPPKIVGMIKADGTFEAADGLEPEEAKRLTEMVEAQRKKDE